MAKELYSPDIHAIKKEEEKEKPKNKHSDKDLDFHIQKIIDKNFDKKYTSKNFIKIDENFQKHLKNEDFDKKEFFYCKKMLLMKKQENCALKSPTHRKKPNPLNKITTNNIVEKEANVIESKINGQNKTDTLLQNIKKNYKTFIEKQIEAEDDEESKSNTNEKKHEFKSPKIVGLILKYKEELNLRKVAKSYDQAMKEKEKIKMKSQEENMKKQSNMNKKREWYNFKSIHTLKHLLDHKKGAVASYFIPKSHKATRKSWLSSYQTTTNSLVNSGKSGMTVNSKRVLSPNSKSQLTLIENQEEKIRECFEIAQNVINLQIFFLVNHQFFEN